MTILPIYTFNRISSCLHELRRNDEDHFPLQKSPARLARANPVDVSRHDVRRILYLMDAIVAEYLGIKLLARLS